MLVSYLTCVKPVFQFHCSLAMFQPAKIQHKHQPVVHNKLFIKTSTLYEA